MIIVSVIMPVYNAMPYLKEAVESVLNQDYKEIELICIDDGSTDNSYDFLYEYAKKDSRLRILSQLNAGAGVARNYGMSVAKGEYLLFLDADDIFHPSLISSAINVARNNNADIVVYRFESFNMKTGVKSACDYAFRKEYWNKSIINRSDNPDKILVSFNPCAWNKLFKKSFIITNNLFFQNNKRTNDLYFVSCAMSIANRIALLDKILVTYRIGNDKSSQSTNSVSELDFFKALMGVKRFLVEKGLDKEVTGSFLSLCENTIIHNLKKSKDNGKAIYEYLQLHGLNELGIDIESCLNLKRYLNKYRILDFNKKISEVAKVKAVVLKERAIIEDVKVSVVIPVYNVQEYLLDCLDSVCSQSLTDIEIIAVNDGSTDSSRDLLLSYQKREPRLTILEQKNAGLSMARNNGQLLSRGKYIYFLDSDDIISQTALEELYNRAENDKLDVLFFDAVTFFDNGIENNHQGYANYYERCNEYCIPRNGIQLLCDMQKNNEYRPSVPLQFINREFYRKNHLSFNPGLLYEDNLFTFKELLVAERSAHIKKKYYKRRLRSESIITSKPNFINAYCYYLCWKGISTIVEQDDSLSQLTEIQDVISRLRQAYERILKGLSDDEKENLIFLSPDDRKHWYISSNNLAKNNYNTIFAILFKTYGYLSKYGIKNTIKKIASKIRFHR